MQAQHYCEHFRNLKFTKTIQIKQEVCCKYCLIGKNYLWLCLAKNCGCFFCDRNHKEHIKMHLEQSKNKKLFHSIFINILTAKIICIHCDIQIYDLDILKINNHNATLPDPYTFRLKILPALSQFDIQKNKIMGQLENSEGHKKINRALTGFFSDRYSYAINSALQFLMQFQLFRDILLTIKPINKEIEELSKLFYLAQQADFRAIHTDVNISQKSQELVKILIHDRPELQGYKRKDPFQHIIYFMTKIHQIIKYYTISYPQYQYDQWDLLSNPATSSKPTLNCPLFDNTSIVLSLNYSCQKCSRQQSLPAHLNFLKLSIPKKKRKTKQVQKQLAQHRFSSPVKNRRKSLVSFFMKQEQCPFTIAQLIIQFLKQPLHKDKICSMCKQQMHKQKNHFQSLPQYLLLQINRMGTDGNSVDMTNIQFSTDPIDLGAFTGNKDNSQIYQLQTALCIQNLCSYPVIAKSRFNKQTYIFKNQLVSMLKLEKNTQNPYILCYKKQCASRNITKLKDCYHNVKSSLDIEVQNQFSQKQTVILPDFWLCQLKNYIQRPLNNQVVCKHYKLRPNVSTKMKKIQRVPTQVYKYLLQMFKGHKFTQKQCKQCLMQNQRIKQRKKKQKQKLIQYEKLKSASYCMISSVWIKRWMNFLYKNTEFAYCSKGNPMPGPIDNKSLLDGQKCKPNLHKNQDYKVVNIFIWRFLKQLYGGGPQIRYKWNKKQINEAEQQQIRLIKQTVKQIKQLYTINYVQSPKKSMIIQKTTSFVESVRGSEDNQQLSLPQQISS